MSAVALDAVGKRYGATWAVREVTLGLEAGERLALLGHNGAGKTTLMKLILGLTQPEAGKVLVLGDRPGHATLAARRKVGFLPENVAFHDAMTGRQTLYFYARLKQCGEKECLGLLDRVGLIDAADRRVGTYSKGMRQRLGLAQALLGGPRLLLLDEPTTGLDPTLRQAFYDIIRELSATGTAVMLSSHLLTELEERTDRIAMMDHGRLVAAGTLDELRRKAGLSVEIRLSLGDGRREAVASALATWSPRPTDAFDLWLSCPTTDKMAALRAIAGLGDDVRDIEIRQPGLDAVYSSFIGVGGGAA